MPSNEKRIEKNRISRQIELIRQGDRRAVAQAVSQVEDHSWEPETVQLLKGLFPFTGKAFIVGVTGSPGAGKSTLVDQLARHYRQLKKRVGVIAVDPTSPFSGGAVLGDRIRMQSLGVDPGAFIRSMATRGQKGGLAPSVYEALLILDAAGYQVLIVETVGVGQDEVDIVKTADVSLVMLVPGMGDDIQTIKAGIMEIGDIFVINKADREGVLRTEQEMDALLAIVSREDGWRPPVVKTVATQGKGIEKLVQAIEDYRKFLNSREGQHSHGVRLFKDRLLNMLRERVTHTIVQRLPESRLEEFAQKVMTRKTDPYTIVDRLLREADLKGDG